MSCLTPIRIKCRKNENGMIRQQGNDLVPCGKCPKCKERRSNDWIMRLQKEESAHAHSLFITLTYAPEHAPITKKGFMTLNKKDVQLFFKRLRKNTGLKNIKYYACGEYGGSTYRPHYHVILFGCPPAPLQNAWGLGYVDIGYDCSGAAIAYTTKYIEKEPRVPAHKNDDRIREFSLMSKNLGKNYLTPQMIKYHKIHLASYHTKDGGYTAALPRYYRNFIFNDEEKTALNYLNQLQKIDSFEKSIAAVGSQKELYRLRFDMIKQIKLQSQQKSNLKRSKI